MENRCFLFPQSSAAVVCIQSDESDSRHEVEVIDLSFSQFSKLELFGFFDFFELRIKLNSFVMLKPDSLQKVIDSALAARKKTKDMEILRLIDKFVEKTNRSKKYNLPIWINA